MAQGDGHRVGGVIRFGNGLQVQQTAGHFHDLPLLRLAVAHHRLLHLAGGVLVDGHAPALGGEQDHAPGLGHADARGDVVVEEQLLHRHGLGLELLQQQLHVIGNPEQPGGQRLPRRGGDGAALHQPLPAAVCLHQAEAHDGEAGVDS